MNLTPFTQQNHHNVLHLVYNFLLFHSVQRHGVATVILGSELMQLMQLAEHNE